MEKEWIVLKRELVGGTIVSRVIAEDLTIQEAQIKCWETGGFAVMKMQPDAEDVKNG